MTARDVPFGRTHDLVGLGRALHGIAPDLGERVTATAPLGAQAMLLRYPSLEEEPPPGEARAALAEVRALVDEVGRWLANQMSDGGRR